MTDDERRSAAETLAPMRAVCESRTARVASASTRMCGTCRRWRGSLGFWYGVCAADVRFAVVATDRPCRMWEPCA